MFRERPRCSSRDDGDEHEQELERKKAHSKALNNDDVDMKIILKITMRITDPLIKEEIRQRSILNRRFGIVAHYLSIAPKRWAGSILSCISRRSASTGADTVSEPSLHYTTIVPPLPDLHLTLPCSLSNH
ncbi:hypothetical protein PAMP_002263 [Pampus punctatissimus]